MGTQDINDDDVTLVWFIEHPSARIWSVIAALLDALPAKVSIQVAPFDIRHMGSEAKFAGMSFTQEQINAAYRQHREKVGNNSRIRWKDPVS